MPTAEGLVTLLISEKLLDAKAAEELKIESLSAGKSIEQLMVDKKLLSPDDLTRVRAKLLDIPFVSLENRGIDPQVFSFIPEAVARRYHAVPFAFDRKTDELSVAMADPTNLDIITFLTGKSGKKIKPFFALSAHIDEVITEQYAQTLSAEVSAALKDSGQPAGFRATPDVGETIREAPIAKIVSTFLEFAIRSRASDVHIEPLENRTRVRYRIDGILSEKLILPKNVQDAVVSRIKILSGMKIDEKRIPQDGRFTYKFGSDIVDLRVSTLPTMHGEKIVMRILKKTGGIPTLSELGLRATALRNLEQSILRPHGIILVSGPTGSGKTTTLYAILSKLNTLKVNIITLEDPVEYEIPGINQVQINPQAGLTFANGLRSFLRQDPNIILVGEIRDSETTSLAIQAALTGHLVFSTLHTNNASTAIPRLLDLNAEPFLVVSVLNAVVAQRIVRQICPSCKEIFSPPPEIVSQIKTVLGPLFTKPEPLSLYRGRGCAECTNSGYFGRIGIFEVLPVTEKIGRLILEQKSATDIEHQAVFEGMITLKQDGFLKVVEGVTTIEEVLRVAQD